MGGLVSLRSYYDPEEAVIVRGALRAAGFDAALSDEHTLAANPHLRIGIGGYRLLVPSAEAEAARQILADLEKGGSDAPVGADAPCANCGGLDFRRRRSVLWATVALLYGSAFAAQTAQSRCLNCGTIVDADRRPVAIRLWFALLALSLIVLFWLFTIG